MTNPLVGRGMNQPLDRRRPRVEWNHGSGGVLKNGLLWGGVGIIFCVYTLTNTWRGCDSWWVNPWPPGSWSVTHPTADCLLCHGPLERVPTAFWWWLTRPSCARTTLSLGRRAALFLGTNLPTVERGVGWVTASGLRKDELMQWVNTTMNRYSLVSITTLSKLFHEDVS